MAGRPSLTSPDHREHCVLDPRRRGDLLFALSIANEKSTPRRTNARPIALETVWSIIPFVVIDDDFLGGAYVYYTSFEFPTIPAMKFTVVGKQWMWKLQHSTGRGRSLIFTYRQNRKVKLTIRPRMCFTISQCGIPDKRTRGSRTLHIPLFRSDETRKVIICSAPNMRLNHSGMGCYVYVMGAHDSRQLAQREHIRATPVEQA